MFDPILVAKFHWEHASGHAPWRAILGHFFEALRKCLGMTSRVLQGPKVTSHSVIDALQRASTLDSEIVHFSHLAHNSTAQSKISAFFAPLT